MNSGRYVVEITGTADDSVERLGGKGKSLNTLVRAGFSVPRAYCVTADAYQMFLKTSGIERWIDGLSSFDLDTHAEIRRRIEQAEIPFDLRHAIVDVYQAIGGESVAVRSSAVDEDGALRSFAGQFDSFLYVKDACAVVDSVKRIWGSLWDRRAQTYRRHQAVAGAAADSKTGIAVVIQAMVDADVAGVLFTADPIDGDSTRTIIESCWGVGEGVVAGKVSTDTYVVRSDHFAVADCSVRQKWTMSAPGLAGGVVTQETPPQWVSARTLTNAKAIELAVQADAIRKHYGQDVDIEWAIKDEKIWILQARPITITASKPGAKIYADAEETDPRIRDQAMFSRLDTGEIVTGLMTPLGLSFCRFYQHHIHGPSVKTMGLRDIGNSQHYMGYLQGHVYLNISASAHLLTQCPPTHEPMKFTQRYANDEVDLSAYVNPYGTPISGFRYLKSGLYWLVIQLRNMLTAGRTVRKMLVLRERETARFRGLNLDAMSLSALDAELKRVDHFFLIGSAAYMPFFLQSFALYDALTELCSKWLNGEGQGLQNRIKAAMNNLRTIEVTRGIVALTETVNASPALRQLFLDTSTDDLIETLERDNEGHAFLAEALAPFLKEFGTRARQEFELSIPRWSDDPTYILQVIRLYLAKEVRIEAQLGATDAAREKDTAQLLAKLPFKIRVLFKLIVSAYGKNAERREAVRPTFIAHTWFYRKIIVEVLSRLERQGVVAVSDLPYIDFNEFRTYVSGKKSAAEAFSKALIERNRRQHLVNRHSKEPPMVIIGGYTPTRETTATVAVDGGVNVIVGLGASPGVAVARARVITDLNRQIDEFQHGEILVTRFTDASWTPLFVLAAGVVADVGSTLSHSSIVSREFGIPAVVNTKTATQTINTGDLIYLDGNAGLVRIEERGKHPAVPATDVERRIGMSAHAVLP
ncbi:MAG: phosphoenolpyruvate synthase [Gammaproteobacteria bacterium]|nr:phosphoenolpyruvate synthase [Gammaproteobacteria bacterium]